MNDEYVIGIDLGTRNTLACYFLKGRKRILKFEGGATMLPSVIYTDEKGDVKVGQYAENLGVTDPENMISSAKTYIGNFELNKTWTCNGRTYTPTDVAIEVLKEVKREFVKRMRLQGDEKIGAVITVPAYFNNNQRDETRKAGTAAGFDVMWILEEPTAAAIEAAQEKQLNKKVMVVDIGGGTFDLSVLDADPARHTYRAIAIDGDDRLGGDDFDKTIQTELIKHIEDDTGLNLENFQTAGIDETEYNILMNRLLIEARHAKEKLSEVTEHEVILPNLTTLGGKNYDLDFILTRRALERICKPLFDRIFNQLNIFAKNNKNFRLDEIGEIILAGGTCFIPYIRERITKDLGIVPNDELPLSQLVVMGAARVAESLNIGIEGGDNERDGKITLKSILPHSLGVEVMNRDGKLVFDRILAKDTPYPCAATQTYQTVFDNQTEIDVNVYEAENENELDLKFHRFRGSLHLKNLPPAPARQTKVDVKFEFTNDQRLKVTVIDKQNVENSREEFIDKSIKKSVHGAATPIDMVLMLDCSGSMRGDDLVQAKRASTELITKMIDLSVHQMALMSFSDKPKILSELTNDASKLTQELPQIEAYGGTAMIEALHAAEKVVENSTRQKIALIVTDGYPDRRQQTLGCARKVRDNGLKIIAIGVGVDFDKNYLDEMVGEKNAFTIKNMSELTKTFEYVINALTRGDL